MNPRHLRIFNDEKIKELREIVGGWYDSTIKELRDKIKEAEEMEVSKEAKTEVIAYLEAEIEKTKDKMRERIAERVKWAEAMIDSL